MADYASLWTSSSDKEFRQMSKYHSLQTRRLGLKMAAILKEHTRHVQRVRVEMRESSTLASQFEVEKERRARHLLKTFSKVQRKRQAAQDWKSAFNRRSSEVVTPGANSVTFDVEIGDESAPYWRPERGGSRRESKDSQFSFRRNSNVSTASSNEAKSPTPWRRPSLVNTGRRRGHSSRLSSSSSSQWSPGRRASGAGSLGLPGKLPAIGAGGGYLSPSPSKPGPSGRGFMSKWQSSVNRHLKDPSIPTEDDEDDKTDSFHHHHHRHSHHSDSNDEDREVATTVPKLKNRQVLWTQTFPYLYHSVGEVCPRYSNLFHQYEECKVYPAKKKSKPRKWSMTSSSITSESDGGQKAANQHRPSFRSLGKVLGAVQSLTAHITAAASK